MPHTIRLSESPVPVKKARLAQRLTTLSQHTLPSGLVIIKRSETPLSPYHSPIPVPLWRGNPHPWDGHPIAPTPIHGYSREGILDQTLLANAVQQRLSGWRPVMPSPATMPNVSFRHSPPRPTPAPAELPSAHLSTSFTIAPGSRWPDSPLALFHRDVQNLFSNSSAPRLVPVPSSATFPSLRPHSAQRRAPSSSISQGTQTDPITIPTVNLVRPILRGLVSLAALQFLTTYNQIILFVTESPALRATLHLYITYFLCPVLRGVHFVLIWIGIFVHIQ